MILINIVINSFPYKEMFQNMFGDRTELNQNNEHQIEPNLQSNAFNEDCTAHQCLPLRRKFMICSIIQLARSILMKHLVIGQRQKASNFSAFNWSLHGRMVSIGQHFVTTRVVHLPKRAETSLFTESDRVGPIR